MPLHVQSTRFPYVLAPAIGGKTKFVFLRMKPCQALFSSQKPCLQTLISKDGVTVKLFFHNVNATRKVWSGNTIVYCKRCCFYTNLVPQSCVYKRLKRACTTFYDERTYFWFCIVALVDGFNKLLQTVYI